MPRKTADFFCYKTVCFGCFSRERRSFDSPGRRESPEPWLGHLTPLSRLSAQDPACLPSVRRVSTRPIRRAYSSGVGHFCAHRIGECVNRCVHLRTTGRIPQPRRGRVRRYPRRDSEGVGDRHVAATGTAANRRASAAGTAQGRGLSVAAAGDSGSTGSAAARELSSANGTTTRETRRPARVR